MNYGDHNVMEST